VKGQKMSNDQVAEPVNSNVDMKHILAISTLAKFEDVMLNARMGSGILETPLYGFSVDDDIELLETARMIIEKFGENEAVFNKLLSTGCIDFGIIASDDVLGCIITTIGMMRLWFPIKLRYALAGTPSTFREYYINRYIPSLDTERSYYGFAEIGQCISDPITRTITHQEDATWASTGEPTNVLAETRKVVSFISDGQLMIKSANVTKTVEGVNKPYQINEIFVRECTPTVTPEITYRRIVSINSAEGFFQYAATYNKYGYMLNIDGINKTISPARIEKLEEVEAILGRRSSMRWCSIPSGVIELTKDGRLSKWITPVSGKEETKVVEFVRGVGGKLLDTVTHYVHLSTLTGVSKHD
jgi:hypothetical protein